MTSAVVAKRTAIVDIFVSICDVLECNRSLFAGCYLFDRAIEMALARKDPDIYDRIDLSAVASFFMAFKLCEMYPPDLEDTLDVLGIAESKIGTILQLESEILKHVEFATSRNCEDFFMGLFGYIIHLSEQQLEDCTALLEYGLLSTHVMGAAPSLRAAGAIYLMYEGMSHFSRPNLDLGMLLYASGYTEKELKCVARQYLTSLRLCRMQNLSSVK